MWNYPTAIFLQITVVGLCSSFWVWLNSPTNDCLSCSSKLLTPVFGVWIVQNYCKKTCVAEVLSALHLLGWEFKSTEFKKYILVSTFAACEVLPVCPCLSWGNCTVTVLVLSSNFYHAINDKSQPCGITTYWLKCSDSTSDLVTNRSGSTHCFLLTNCCLNSCWYDTPKAWCTHLQQNRYLPIASNTVDWSHSFCLTKSLYCWDFGFLGED